MARFTGFRCDLCSTAEEGSGREKNDTPIGWITVVVKSDQDLHDGQRLLCSNVCLFKFASERKKADRDLLLADRQAAKEQKGQTASRMNHARFHEAEGVTDPECPWCHMPNKAE